MKRRAKSIGAQTDTTAEEAFWATDGLAEMVLFPYFAPFELLAFAGSGRRGHDIAAAHIAPRIRARIQASLELTRHPRDTGFEAGDLAFLVDFVRSLPPNTAWIRSPRMLNAVSAGTHTNAYFIDVNLTTREAKMKLEELLCACGYRPDDVPLDPRLWRCPGRNETIGLSLVTCRLHPLRMEEVLYDGHSLWVAEPLRVHHAVELKHKTPSPLSFFDAIRKTRKVRKDRMVEIKLC